MWTRSLSVWRYPLDNAYRVSVCTRFYIAWPASDIRGVSKTSTLQELRTRSPSFGFLSRSFGPCVLPGWRDWRSMSRLVMVALWNRADHYIFMLWFVLLMVALCNRADHYIFALWFLSIFLLLLLLFFSSPNLSGRRLDVYHTSTHGVALVRI